jgi:predicted RNA-binding Zn ribbon-like protein
MAVSGIVEGITAERVRDALTLLQAGLRAALSRLRAGRNWSPPSVPVSLVVERGRMRRVLTSPDGTPGPILLAAAADVLLAHWEQVRTCEAAGCDRLFVPADRRQKYCSAECGQRVRWQRFAPKRQRDYAAEYAHRVRKRLGASRVRVGRKKRRQLFGS